MCFHIFPYLVPVYKASEKLELKAEDLVCLKWEVRVDTEKEMCCFGICWIGRCVNCTVPHEERPMRAHAQSTQHSSLGL